MSNLDRAPRESLAGGRTAVATAPVHDLLTGREVVLGGPRDMRVSRTLPNRGRRMVGAWCFLDAYGPEDLVGRPGMRVPPHPHTGLQTVSWLIAGEVLHRDSLGSTQLVRPGQLNLMTAGHAISHAEDTPAEHSGTLHGVQLWTALPDTHRHVAPHFEHHPDLPVVEDTGMSATVILGELAGVASPATTYSPLVGADIRLAPDTDTHVPLEPDFEYAALTIDGSPEIDGEPLAAGPLLYLGTGRTQLSLRAPVASRLLLLGGEPFAEEILMWWNFVGRSHEEIVADRTEWMTGERFGTVRDYPGDPLPAPAMPATRLKPRGRSG